MLTRLFLEASCGGGKGRGTAPGGPITLSRALRFLVCPALAGREAMALALVAIGVKDDEDGDGDGDDRTMSLLRLPRPPAFAAATTSTLSLLEGTMDVCKTLLSIATY